MALFAITIAVFEAVSIGFSSGFLDNDGELYCVCMGGAETTLAPEYIPGLIGGIGELSSTNSSISFSLLFSNFPLPCSIHTI